MNDEQLLRYSRHILLDAIGIEGQRRIINARVLVIGAFLAVDTTPGGGTTIDVSMKMAMIEQQADSPGGLHATG